MGEHASAAAAAIGRRLTAAANAAGVWREQATTVVVGGGNRVKTTGYLPGAVEAAEAWAFLDPLDEIQVGDEAALISMGGANFTLGKVLRVAATVARISRNVTLGAAGTAEHTLWGHLTTKGASPTPSVGAALGTGGSVGVSIVGNDTNGRVSGTAGTSGMTTGVLVTATFAVPRLDGNYAVLLTPEGSTATEITWYNSNRASTYFSIRTTSVPVAGTTYLYGYIVIGH